MNPPHLGAAMEDKRSSMAFVITTKGKFIIFKIIYHFLK
jgi:hypothetical protein